MHQHIRSKSKCPECIASDEKKSALKSVSSSRSSSWSGLVSRFVKADYEEGEVMHGRGIGHWIHGGGEEEEEEDKIPTVSLFAKIRQKLDPRQETQHIED